MSVSDIIISDPMNLFLNVSKKTVTLILALTFFCYRCRNCGSVEHRHWECPEQKNVTNNVLCTKCGAAGHLATDCIQTG